ncbi:deoxyguanosinetriphosphate triphosphohydrolase-like protein [compost metagenome]
MAREELNILQEFVKNNVIKTPEVQTLEYKGQQMIVKLFDTIANNPSRLLPRKYFDKYKLEGDNLRVICDYIAGTTDDYATRLYHKIFTPSSGSIFDKL